MELATISFFPSKPQLFGNEQMLHLTFFPLLIFVMEFLQNTPSSITTVFINRSSYFFTVKVNKTNKQKVTLYDVVKKTKSEDL